MKKIIYLILPLFFINCDIENANDCFQETGSIVTEEISISTFTKIRVNRGVELILKEGAVHRVIVEAGENLINDVNVDIENSQLIITDNNTCNFIRDYNPTKVYVTAPNITEIISSTQFKIQSDGVLNYNSLKVTSEDYTDTSVIAVGDVILKLNSQNVTVVANNLTHFSFSGFTQNLSVQFVSGDGVFDGANLIANTVSVYHRGTNNIIVNPQVELNGELRSTGDLIAKNHPPIVNVAVLYTGDLIFN